MSQHSMIIACRDAAEAARLREALGEPSTPVYHKSLPFLSRIDSTPGCFVIVSSLILDETATGLLTKASILEPRYSVLFASDAGEALNLVRVYGCGCAEVVGPDELAHLKACLEPSEAYLNEMVMPPFFIDDEESSLKDPPLNVARPLHVTCIGAQALMSCSNALLNIDASSAMSFSCVGPRLPWALEHYETSLRSATLWNVQRHPKITGGTLTLCQDFSAVASLEPTGQHVVLCHGHVSEQEAAYLERLPAGTRVFMASDEGYVENASQSLESVIDPERLWDMLISALYQV